MTLPREIPCRCRLADARDKDELKPLREAHLVHAERPREIILFRLERCLLPEVDAPHFSLDAVDVGKDRQRVGGHNSSTGTLGFYLITVGARSARVSPPRRGSTVGLHASSRHLPASCV